MELFDKKFVHFMWDDKLKGKKCFVADNIGALKTFVEINKSSMLLEVAKGDGDYPFAIDWTDTLSDKCRFAYYDPNYEAKWEHYKGGKKIQVFNTLVDNWIDSDEPKWLDSCEYRVKPEEEKTWVAYLSRPTIGDCRLASCYESNWEAAQRHYGAKTQLFAGTYDEVEKWCQARQKFSEAIKAWEDGKTIQIRCDGGWWNDCKYVPIWSDDCEYRIKPEETWIAYLVRSEDSKGCYLTACLEDRWESVQKQYHAKTKLFVGTESEVEGWYSSRQKFAEVIKAWEDGKEIQIKNGRSHWDDIKEPGWGLKNEYRVKTEKQYRPYKGSAEMIDDYLERFNASCLSYCEPLIWVKGKNTDNRYLLTSMFPEDGVRFGAGFSSFQDLFNGYTYLNGSPVGMEMNK